MLGKRFWLSVMVLALSVPMMALNASAWEFKMSGAFTYQYDMATQMGPNGFFGRHNDSATIPAGLPQTINFWPGGQFPHRTAAGAITHRTVATKKAESMSQWFSTDMAIKVNPAVSIHGRYRVGGWAPAMAGTGPANVAPGALMASRHYVKTASNIQESMSPGYWEYFRIKAKLPAFNMSLGKRPSTSPLGINANAFSSDSESISMSAPYGPLSLNLSFYLGRPGVNYYNRYDGGGTRTYNTSFGPSYDAGPLSIALGWDWLHQHNGGETGQVNTGIYRDQVDSVYWGYLLYNNGRFFFNAEAELYHVFRLNYRDTNHDGVNDAMVGGINGNNLVTQDDEDLGYGVEFGTFIGPAKLSFIYLHDEGPDRRANAGGQRLSIFRDGAQNAGFTHAFYPYSLLMAYSYGFGTGEYLLGTAEGALQSGTFLATRLDYAVAANLNAYGTFALAYQPYKGFGFGYIHPDVNGDIQFQRIESAAGGNTNRSAAIPVEDLGYEFNVGIDWQLLEGLMFSSRFAYWQPGEWFKYACIDKEMGGNWTLANGNALWNVGGGDPTLPGLVNPNRAIDPVISLISNVVVEY